MRNRRRAVEGKLIRKSKSNPGYYKYQFIIREVNGKENTIPSYGIDMSDALDRILKNERKQKITEVYVNKIQPAMLILITLSWITSIALSTIYKTHPEYAFYGTISLMSIVLIYAIFKFYRDLYKNETKVNPKHIIKK